MLRPEARGRRPWSPWRALAAAVAAGLVAAPLGLAAAGSQAARVVLPQACSLLTQAEASTLAGIKMLAPQPLGSLCQYNGDPNGSPAQVTVTRSGAWSRAPLP